MFKRKKVKDDEKVMSLSGHLKELRNRIIVCLVFLFAGFGFCFYNAETIVAKLTAMGLNSGYSFVYLSPQELLVQYMRVGLTGAVLICIPVIIYEVYAFIAPGLEKYEKPFLMLSLVFGQICFVLGVAFAHKISMPFMLGFLYKINGTDYITSSISIESYLSFVLMVYIIFGIIFEMPVISAIMTRFGIMKSAWLVKGRSIAIVLCFVVAALITPPDIISQIMVAIPMMMLYQVSIFISKAIEKLKRKKESEE